MNKNHKYKALDDLIELSKTVKIENDLYDVFPVSYNSIYNLTASYLFMKSGAEFWGNLWLLSNPVRRLINGFSFFNLKTAHPLQRVLFPAQYRNILTEKGKFINDSNVRNSAFLSNKWVDADLEFLSFHDLLIYKICSRYLAENGKKIFTIKIGEEIRIMTSSIHEDAECLGSIKSTIVNGGHLPHSAKEVEKFSRDFAKSLADIAEETGKDVTFEDSFLSIIFGKIKLGQKEFISTSSAWFYEYWWENHEDFSEEMVGDDIKLFSNNVALIIGDERVQKLLIELYKNLTSLRRCNFSNPRIEDDLEIELKIKESYNHLISIIEENQDLISEFFKDSELKPYLEIKDKKRLLENLDSMLKFFKIKNYADKFFDKNLINNHKISTFLEEDGIFYRVVGVKKGHDEKSEEEGKIFECFADKTRSFFDEGMMKNLVIFDHLTNKKVVIPEERQVYVDSKELLNLLMKDFLGKRYFEVELRQNADLEELTDIFSKKICENVVAACSGSIKIESTNQKDRLIEFIGVHRVDGQKYTEVDNEENKKEIGFDDGERFEAAINNLEEDGFINKRKDVLTSGKYKKFLLELTDKGWRKLDEIFKTTEGEESEQNLIKEELQESDTKPIAGTALGDLIEKELRILIKEGNSDPKPRQVLERIKTIKLNHSELIEKIDKDGIVWIVPSTRDKKNMAMKSFINLVGKYKNQILGKNKSKKTIKNPT
jgi:hypothetical protein